MLTYLSIENFAIIEKAELEFHAGITMMTGETGAGKSIILDAIELVLGARAESHLIRADSKKCEISAIFDITNYPFIQTWLAEKEIETTQECFLRRILSDDGRSRSFINHKPVPLQLVRELGTLLVNLHGQHEHQLLLSHETHREYLDAYGHHEENVEIVRKLYTQYRQIEDQLKQHHHQFDHSENRLAFLQYQLAELSALNLTQDSLMQLEIEHKSLSQIKDHLQTYHLLLNILDENLLPFLHKAQQASHLLDKLPLLFDNACIQLEEARNEIKHITEKADLNPDRLAEIEKQLTQIYDLARKHRVKPQMLPELYQHLDQELASLQHKDVVLKNLEKSLAEIKEKYCISAKKLSESRRQTAPQMAQEIQAFIHELGMKGAQFSIALIPHDSEETQVNLHGLEKIAFQVSANPGQPLQALSKVASGGELSRLSLAIALIAARNHALPTLIFDEVDVGISGSIAAKVGQLLRQLSQNVQVISITHLPQVAAVGKYHLHIHKTVKAGKTFAHMRYLNAEEKIHEIARMLGGIEVTKQALSHARNLVES